MCKTHEAIYDIAKMVENDKIVLWVDGVEIRGTLADCDCKEEKCRCFEDILSLKDACAKCNGEKKTYKWLNIPTWGIKGFTFECCCT